MTRAEKTICEYTANFIDENFNRITYDLSRSGLPTTKDRLVEYIGKDPQVAMWVLTELSYWDKGLEQPDITVFVGDGYKVLKIHSEYIRVDSVNYTWHFKNVKPKKKTVIYYE